MERNPDAEKTGRSTLIAATVAAVASVAAALIALGGSFIPIFYRDYQWEMVKIGDCNDIDESHKETTGPVRGSPNADECNANFRNKIAVCWDGKTFQNETKRIPDSRNKSWCAYKNVNLKVCDASPKTINGVIWECKERRIGTWADIRAN